MKIILIISQVWKSLFYAIFRIIIQLWFMEGHMEGGKFHPHSNDEKKQVSTDQVKEVEESTIDKTDVEKLKEQKS